MRLREFFILLVIFTAIVIGSSTFLGNVSKNYGVETQSVGSMKIVEDIRTEMTDFEKRLQEIKTGVWFLDIPYMIVSGAYTVLKLTLINIPILWTNFISEISMFLGIPQWATSIIFLLIFATLIFEILTVLFKWEI